MDNITVKKWTLSMRPIEKYTDPRQMQIDLATDYVITKNHPDTTIHNDRVMPLNSFKTFLSILKLHTPHQDTAKRENKYQCFGTTQKGLQCKRKVSSKGSYCYQHAGQK